MKFVSINKRITSNILLPLVLIAGLQAGILIFIKTGASFTKILSECLSYLNIVGHLLNIFSRPIRPIFELGLPTFPKFVHRFTHKSIMQVVCVSAVSVFLLPFHCAFYIYVCQRSVNRPSDLT